MSDEQKPSTKDEKTVDIHVPTDNETERFGGGLQLPTGEDVDLYGSPVQVATLGEIQKYASNVPPEENQRLRDTFGDPDKKKHDAISMLLELTDGDINPASVAKVHRLIDEAAVRFAQHKQSGASNIQLILTDGLSLDTPNPFGDGTALANRFSKISVTTPETGEKQKKTVTPQQKPKGNNR